MVGGIPQAYHATDLKPPAKVGFKPIIKTTGGSFLAPGETTSGKGSSVHGKLAYEEDPTNKALHLYQQAQNQAARDGKKAGNLVDPPRAVVDAKLAYEEDPTNEAKEALHLKLQAQNQAAHDGKVEGGKKLGAVMADRQLEIYEGRVELLDHEKAQAGVDARQRRDMLLARKSRKLG